MRFLTRLLLFWIIAAPLFWFAGLPLLLQHLSARTQLENMAACRQQLASQGLVPGRLSAEAGTRYCSCLNKVLFFRQEDLLEMVTTRKLSTRLQTALNKQITQCSSLLQPGATATPVEKTPVRLKDGSMEYQL